MLTDNNSINTPLIGKTAAYLINRIKNINLNATKNALSDEIKEIQESAKELEDAIGALVDHQWYVCLFDASTYCLTPQLII